MNARKTKASLKSYAVVQERTSKSTVGGASAADGTRGRRRGGGSGSRGRKKTGKGRGAKSFD